MIKISTLPALHHGYGECHKLQLLVV